MFDSYFCRKFKSKVVTTGMVVGVLLQSIKGVTGLALFDLMGLYCLFDIYRTYDIFAAGALLFFSVVITEIICCIIGEPDKLVIARCPLKRQE